MVNDVIDSRLEQVVLRVYRALRIYSALITTSLVSTAFCMIYNAIDTCIEQAVLLISLALIDYVCVDTCVLNC
jgi:hypothetical protein